MSDVPWAVAWYGRRQSVWLTLDAQDEFYEMNDFRKTVNAIYLTPVTTDKKFVSGWISLGEKSWGAFIIDTLMNKQVPPTFPLRKSLDGFLPEQVFLSDWERWRQ